MSGWRKRQVVEMARESWLDVYGLGHDRESFIKALEAFSELVRADEREALCKVMEDQNTWDMYDPNGFATNLIRTRGKHD